MNDKIWKFDILIDDSFVNFNPNSVEITPDTNDFLISLVNGFEEGHWMKKNFQNFRLYRYCPCLRDRTANQISGYSGRNNLDYLYLCDMAKKSNTSLAYETLLNIILPDGILEIFEVSNVREEHTGIIEETGLELRIIHIHLDERDLRVKEWHDLRPNGFTEEHCINDFPIRDRKVVLHVRRRRWLDDEGKNVILPHEGLTAPGTSYSKEFADVLKKIFGCLPDTGPLSGAVL